MATVTSVELVWAPVRGGPSPIVDGTRSALPLFTPRGEGGCERVELAAVRPADGRPDQRAERPNWTGHTAVGQQARARPIAVRRTGVDVICRHPSLNGPQGDAAPWVECGDLPGALLTPSGEDQRRAISVGPCARSASTPGIHRVAESQSISRAHTTSTERSMVVSAVNTSVISALQIV